MILTIKKAEFITASNGEMSQLIEFPVSGKTKKRGFNALVINDHSLMRKSVKGVKLKLDFDDNMVVKKIDVLTESPNVVHLPSVCSTCGTKYSEVGEKLFCKNVVCPSVSHSCLFKMLSWVSANGVKCTRDDHMLFLSQFAMKEGTASIDNLTELKMLINLFKEYYNTKPRLKNWVDAHGDKANLLHSIEINLHEFLVSKQQNSVFWDICNFPKITEDQSLQLSKINPTRFLKGEESIKHLDKKTRKFLENNMDFIVLLAEITGGMAWND